MSFFDDKQEILSIELTTYGRYLISRGKFKPVYYAFFDDDILYDAKYASINATAEPQNDIQTRILDETLSLKPQTTFTSIQNSVKLNALLIEEVEKMKMEESQISADRNYALSLPLANSAIGSDYAPAWSLQFLNGKIDSVSQSIDNSNNDQNILQPYLKYPQINLQDSLYDIRKSKNDSSVLPNYKLINIFTTGSDKTYYSINEQPVILDLSELNVDDVAKNFDIEIFIEEEEKILGTTNTKTSLKQLNFKKDTVSILNGLLLDEPITFEVETDNTFAEYYFEMTVDNEIQLPPQQKSSVGSLPYPNSANKAPFGVDC